MLSKKQQIIKRSFDIIASFFSIILCFLPILVLIMLATLSTKEFGLFTQKRVGRHANVFTMFKIRTMKFPSDENFITVRDDPRLTAFGKIFKKISFR